MKLPKTVLLNLKMSAKNAEQSRSEISFYPAWILPIKFIIVFFALIYLTGFFYYQNILNEFRINLILDLLLFIVIIIPLSVFLKKMIISFIKNVNDKSVSPGFTPPVSLLLFLGNDKNQNQKSIESVLELSYPNYELLLLSNSEAKYSNVDKEIVGLKKFSGKEIKVSMLHSKNANEIDLVNTGLKISLSKYCVLLQPNIIIKSNALMIAMKYFKNDSTKVVLGKMNASKKLGIFLRVFELSRSIDSQSCEFKNDLEINILNGSDPLIFFRNEKNSGIEIISLGKSKRLTLTINKNKYSSNVINDPKIRVKDAEKNSDQSSIYRFMENELFKFDELIQQWNYLYLKNKAISKRLKLDWQIFKFLFPQILHFIINFIFIFTAAVTSNFEYLVYWVIFISVINILKTIFAASLDFSMMKNILSTILFKWAADLFSLSLKVFLLNKSLLLNSLIFARLKK